MTDQLSTCKSVVLKASSGSLADLFAEAISHFTTAPNFWELAGNNTNESFFLRLKSAYTQEVRTIDPHIALRRETSSMRAMLDPSKLITDAGDATTPISTTSTDHSGEVESALPTNLLDKVLITELKDALFMLFVDATQGFTPWGLHAGSTWRPRNAGIVAHGGDGYGIHTGKPRGSSAGNNDYWFNTDNGSPSNKIKMGNVLTSWVAGSLPSVSTNPGVEFQPDDDGVHKRLANGFEIRANDIAGEPGDDAVVGATKYFCGYPTQTHGTRLPFVKVEGVNQAFIYIYDAATLSYFCMPWEKGALLNLSA